VTDAVDDTRYKIVYDKLESRVISHIEDKGLSSYLQGCIKTVNTIFINWSKEEERDRLVIKYLEALNEVEKIENFKEFLIFFQIMINFSLFTGVRLEGEELRGRIVQKGLEFVSISTEEQLISIGKDIKSNLCWDGQIIKNINKDWEGYTFIGAHKYSKSLWNIFKADSVEELAKKLFKVLGKLTSSEINKEFLNIDTKEIRSTGYSGKVEEYVESLNLYYLYLNYIWVFFKILGFKSEWEQVYVEFRKKFKARIKSEVSKSKEVIEQKFRTEILTVLDAQVREYDVKYNKYKNKVEKFKIAVSEDKGIGNFLIDNEKSIFVTSNVDIKELIEIIRNFDEAKISENKDESNKLLIDIINTLKVELLWDIMEKVNELSGCYGISVEFNKDKVEKYYRKYNDELYRSFKDLLNTKKQELKEICKEVQNIKPDNFSNKFVRYLESTTAIEINKSYKDKINLALVKYDELDIDKWNGFAKDLNILIGEEQIAKYDIEYSNKYNKAHTEVSMYVKKYNQIISKAEYLKEQIIELPRYDELVNEQSNRMVHIVLWDEMKNKLENILNKFKNNLEKIAITSLYEKYKNTNYQTRSDMFRQIKVKEIEYSALSTKVIEKGIFESENLKAIKELL
jgi:hypothetical protein